MLCENKTVYVYPDKEKATVKLSDSCYLQEPTLYKQTAKYLTQNLKHNQFITEQQI